MGKPTRQTAPRPRRRPPLARPSDLALAVVGTEDAEAHATAYRKLAQAFLAWRVRTGRVDGPEQEPGRK